MTAGRSRRRWAGLWCAVPKRAMQDERFCAKTRVLMAISWHARSVAGCYAKLETLAKETNLERSTVSETIAALVDAKYIEKEPSPTDRRRFIYRPIHDPPPADQRAESHSANAERSAEIVRLPGPDRSASHSAIAERNQGLKRSSSST